MRPRLPEYPLVVTSDQARELDYRASQEWTFLSYRDVPVGIATRLAQISLDWTVPMGDRDSQILQGFLRGASQRLQENRIRALPGELQHWEFLAPSAEQLAKSSLSARLWVRIR